MSICFSIAITRNILGQRRAFNIESEQHISMPLNITKRTRRPTGDIDKRAKRDIPRPRTRALDA